MQPTRRGLLAAVLACGFVWPAAAQGDFACRNLEGVIQWGAGGSTDRVSRAVTPLVEPHLGKEIVLVNKPGGSGVIAMQYVLSRPADGCTLLYGAENPQLYPVLGLADFDYRAVKPVVLLARGTPILVARADAPWDSLEALVEDARARPGEIAMGATGAAGLPAVVLAMMRSELPDFDVNPVPFDGDGPALTALQGGHVDFMPAVYGAARELVRAGRVKPLAVVGTARLPGLEGVPAITELYPDFARFLPWGPFFGVFVREETPEPLFARLADAFTKGAGDPKFREIMDDAGLEVMNLTGAEAEAFLARWQSVTAWLLADLGAAKADPASLGIPRP